MNSQMKVIVDLCVVPMGVDVFSWFNAKWNLRSSELNSVPASCREIGNRAQRFSHFANIGGDWDEVFAAIKRCNENVPRYEHRVLQPAPKLACARIANERCRKN